MPEIISSTSPKSTIDWSKKKLKLVSSMSCTDSTKCTSSPTQNIPSFKSKCKKQSDVTSRAPVLLTPTTTSPLALTSLSQFSLEKTVDSTTTYKDANKDDIMELNDETKKLLNVDLEAQTENLIDNFSA